MRSTRLRGSRFSSTNRRTLSCSRTVTFVADSGSSTADTLEMMYEKMNPPRIITPHAMRRSATVCGTTLPYPTVVSVCTAQYSAAMYSSQCKPSRPLWSSRAKLYTEPYPHAMKCDIRESVKSIFEMVTNTWYLSKVSAYASKTRTAR